MIMLSESLISGTEPQLASVSEIRIKSTIQGFAW